MVSVVETIFCEKYLSRAKGQEQDQSIKKPLGKGSGLGIFYEIICHFDNFVS